MNKQTLVVVIVAVVLVALLFMFENPFTPREPSRKGDGKAVELVVPMDENEISRIEISTGQGMSIPIRGTSITLTRRGREWFTGAYRADQDAVKRLIEGLREIEDPQLVSINPDSHMNFRVHALLGKRIRVFDMAGELKTDVIVGEIKEDFFSVALRRPDSDNVYEARSRLRSVLMRPSWRDKNILRLDRKRVRSISVKSPTESYTLVRNAPNDWAFDRPTTGPADNQQVRLLLSGVTNLIATDFVRPTKGADALTSYGLTDPPATLTVGLDDGSSITVLFGNEEPIGATALYYAKRTDSPQVFKVSEPTFTNVIRQSVTLKPPLPPKRTPGPEPPRPTTGTATTPDGGAAASSTSPPMKATLPPASPPTSPSAMAPLTQPAAAASPTSRTP